MIIVPILATLPIVIAHRGASAYRPEHTLAAYELAIDQGADYIEPDLVLSKDGVLVARHENEISGTTDVASRPEFADRKTTKSIDGARVTGWFTEDFTWAELATLRARERLGAVRPGSSAYNGQFGLARFRDVLEMVRRRNVGRKSPIGIYPETKYPAYFDRIQLRFDAPLRKELAEFGYGAGSPCFIQSFEIANLRRLRPLTPVGLVQLIDASGGPADAPGRTYAEMVTDAGLAEIRTYADGIGVAKSLVLPVRDGALGSPTHLVQRAHRAGLKVHVWTLRPEPMFLPKSIAANPAAEVRAFIRAGVDGLFTDAPDVAVRARDAAE
ncbi:MAG: glycerophosphodiester phosphodiesterase [Fimbriimonadaceae bacterium]|nr:glycerophosphodiester phosphodiesterase [Fimbriimonadaceae bacterium]